MNATGSIIALAYPDAIVHLSDEWYSGFLRFLGVGRKNYVRAGHAALVLINNETGVLEYYDFGRYITPKSYGRVRGYVTDNELKFPFKAIIKSSTISNLDSILVFLATHPEFTHGEGRLVASVCDQIDYNDAKSFIKELQKDIIPYAAFSKNGSNCSRFVTDTIIASTTNKTLKSKLVKSKWFTPSPVGNVIRANTQEAVYEVSDAGEVSIYNKNKKKEVFSCFFDRLSGFEPNLIGNIKPKYVKNVSEHAQWLAGTGAGAWFELFKTDVGNEFRYRRISPYGTIDVDAIFIVEKSGFLYSEPYQFVYYSNCLFFHVLQNDIKYRFNRKF